jgi:hypothetical protein
MKKVNNMNKDNKNTEVDSTDKKLHISDVIHSIFGEFHEMSVKYIKEYERELYRVGDIDKEKLYTNRAKSEAIEECIKVLKKYCV